MVEVPGLVDLLATRTPVQLWRDVMALPEPGQPRRCPKCWSKDVAYLHRLGPVTILQTLELSVARRFVASGVLERSMADPEDEHPRFRTRDWWVVDDGRATCLQAQMFRTKAGRTHGLVPGETVSLVPTWCRRCGEIEMALPRR